MENILHSKFNYKTRILWSVIMCAAFALFTFIIGNTTPFTHAGFEVMLALMWIITCATLLYFSFTKRLDDVTELILFSLLLFGAIYVRISYMDFESADYKSFLTNWVSYFRKNGGIFAIKNDVGDYNIPYLYFIAVISYFKTSELYLIKIFSIIFDFLLAVFAFKLVAIFTEKKLIKFGVFFAVLYLPNVWLNSSMWAQCDVIYTAFIIIGIYYALKDRPWLCMAMLSLAFAFKLQAVFFFPACFALLLLKKIKIKHVLIFPLTYLIVILPALLLGKPIINTVSIYFKQAGQYSSSLSWNAPTIYNLHYIGIPASIQSLMGVGLTFVLILAACIYLFKNMKHITPPIFITVALLSVLTVPFLLPYMHDRYFFMADILSVIFAFLNRKYFYVCPMIVFGSFICVEAYLSGVYMFNVAFASTLMLISIFMVATFMVLQIREERLKPVITDEQ